jgi:fructose-bisphosphate aldolase class II
MTGTIRKQFVSDPSNFDPRKYLAPAREAIYDMVKHKILVVLGSDGKL